MAGGEGFAPNTERLLRQVLQDAGKEPPIPFTVQYSAYSSDGFQENAGVLGLNFGQQRALEMVITGRKDAVVWGVV